MVLDSQIKNMNELLSNFASPTLAALWLLALQLETSKKVIKIIKYRQSKSLYNSLQLQNSILLMSW